MYQWNPDDYSVSLDPFAAWRPEPPRPAPAGMVWCTPETSGLGAAHAAHAAELRALREAEEERRSRPARPMMGPAKARALGVWPPTTPDPRLVRRIAAGESL